MTAELRAPVRLHTNIFRGCPRCSGTLRLERDIDSVVDHDGYDYVCLQCGRRIPVSAVMLQLQDMERTHLT